MRLGNREVTRIRELTDALGTWTEGAASPWRGVLDAFSELTEAEKAVCFGVEQTEAGLRLAFVHDVGFSVPFLSSFNRMASSEDENPSPTSLLVPSPSQRNRPMALASFQSLSSRADSMKAGSPFGTGPTKSIMALMERRLEDLNRLGVGRNAQARVLLADGARALGWFGALRPDPFTPREVAILRALVPALHRRLRLEQWIPPVGLDPLHALETVLEHMPAPSFILAPSGGIAHLNAAGRRLLERAGPDLTRALRATARSTADPRFTVTPIRSTGRASYRLVTVENEADPTARLERARTRWALTQRQVDVLELVVLGRSNAQIAARLGLSERTVEIHVSALLTRSGRSSRVELVAELWRRL